MSKKKWEPVEETCHEDHIICPHCGLKQSDSWDFGEGNDYLDAFDDYQCDECEKWFRWSRNTTITYSTTALPGDPDEVKP